MLDLYYKTENPREEQVCKTHGHCSGNSLKKKLQEITLFGLDIFSKQAKERPQF